MNDIESVPVPSERERKGDGGAAFPVTLTDKSGQIAPTELGMSLRDYFAAKALIGYIASFGECALPKDKSNMAKEMYEVADAMIAEKQLT